MSIINSSNHFTVFFLNSCGNTTKKVEPMNESVFWEITKSSVNENIYRQIEIIENTLLKQPNPDITELERMMYQKIKDRQSSQCNCLSQNN